MTCAMKFEKNEFQLLSHSVACDVRSLLVRTWNSSFPIWDTLFLWNSIIRAQRRSEFGTWNAHFCELAKEEMGSWILKIELYSCNMMWPASSVAHFIKNPLGVPLANSVMIRAVMVQADEPYL